MAVQPSTEVLIKNSTTEPEIMISYCPGIWLSKQRQNGLACVYREDDGLVKENVSPKVYTQNMYLHREDEEPASFGEVLDFGWKSCWWVELGCSGAGVRPGPLNLPRT